MKISKFFILKSAFLFFLTYICITDTSAACVFSHPLQITEVQIGNVLSWSTRSEVNHAYFRVEKSIDGILFTEAGRVKEGANKGGERSYRLLDAGIGESRIFYRLALVSADESVEYTKTVLFNRYSSNNIKVVEMSSVITDALFTVTLQSAQAGLMTFKISNVSGAVTKSGESRIEIGARVLNFDLRGFEKGMYELSMNLGGETEKLWIKKVETADAPQILLSSKNK